MHFRWSSYRPWLNMSSGMMRWVRGVEFWTHQQLRLPSAQTRHQHREQQPWGLTRHNQTPQLLANGSLSAPQQPDTGTTDTAGNTTPTANNSGTGTPATPPPTGIPATTPPPVTPAQVASMQDQIAVLQQHIRTMSSQMTSAGIRMVYEPQHQSREY